MNRVLLVDDHTSFREMLAFVFDREPEFEVVAQVGSLAEACRMLEGVDLALVDLVLPDGDGTDLIGPLLTANQRARVLVLTASADRRVHARAVEAGACGVLHKSVRIKDVIGATRRVMAGETLLPPDEVIELLRLASRQREQNYKAQRAIEQLTPRERAVLQVLAEGLSDKEIADKFHVSPGTIRNHVASILSKLETQSRLQALVFAVRHGTVKIDETTGRI